MSQYPLANANIKNYAGYDNPQFTITVPLQGVVGLPAVAGGVITTGNGLYVIATAPANGAFVDVLLTVASPGTGATSNVQVRLISANNGANVSQNVALGNLITTGVNVAGNVFTTGPLNYNVFANGAASSTNTSLPGGFSCNAGDVLVAISTGNTLVAGTSTNFRYNPVTAAFVA